jgi:hypothetical protein
MTSWLQDLRYAFRQVRKSPGFTIAAVLTLAVAIGANAVVFAALDGLVWRPLNVPHAESLFEVGRAENNNNESYPNYLDLRDRNHSFDFDALARLLLAIGCMVGCSEAANVAGAQNGSQLPNEEHEEGIRRRMQVPERMRAARTVLFVTSPYS